LLQVPYLKIVGGVVLLWIAVQLLVPDSGSAIQLTTRTGVAAVMRTVILADVVMSLDNVLGVAAAAHGNLHLIVLGLLFSVPLIVFGSTLLLKLMDRLPLVVTGGAALLGYVAGEMLLSDAVTGSQSELPAWIRFGVPLLAAGCVVACGKRLAYQRRRASPALVDLVEPTPPRRDSEPS
jgi:predicted tellurium resistance membrane protein TerC